MYYDLKSDREKELMMEIKNFNEFEDYYRERAQEYQIPDHMIEGLVFYIVYGRPTGGFLTSLLKGDLFLTFSVADCINRKCIENYIKFLYNCAPANCFGSEENVKYWSENGGLKGILHPENE